MKTNVHHEMKLAPTGRTITIELYSLDELSEEARKRAYNSSRQASR